ncbi:hypothetical protein [Pseudomonas sp. S9]|uniref:hypothetical protein n=1 Tax=Pseudomonas sp. S9 TaxID=686578 RepID=UPI0003171C6B|nr:hypothetical protein [Pseudomonas sp. S9]
MFIMLFVIGFLLPSSLNSVITPSLLLGDFFISVLLAAALFSNCIRPRQLFSVSIVLSVLLCLFIVLSSAINLSSGVATFGYVVIFLKILIVSLLVCPNYNYALRIYYSYLCVSFVLVFLGVGVLWKFDFVSSIIESWYADFYDLLVPNMIAADRPVGVFASHSIAAFSYFVLAVSGVYYYRAGFGFVNLIFSFVFLIYIFFLDSYTSYFMMILFFCFCISLFYTLISNVFIKVSCLCLFVCFGTVMVLAFAPYMLGTDANGFMSRYGDNGVLASAFNFFVNNPLIGLGIIKVPSVYLTDSGYLESLVRGGLVYTIVLYFSYIVCMFRLLGRFDLSLFIVVFSFFCFEIGFPIMSYERTFYLLLILSSAVLLYKNTKRKKLYEEN